MAMHEPFACALHVPWHLPLQLPMAVPMAAAPSHMPWQLPPQTPLKFAVQPASHVPVHIGAVQDPVQLPLHITAAVAVHSPLQLPMHATLGPCTSQAALQVPLHPTSTEPPVQFAVTSQFAFASHDPSQLAWALTLAEQLNTTLRLSVAPAARSALMCVLRTVHASDAVVFDVSSPRSPLIPLQMASHCASTPAAALLRPSTAPWNAKTVAWALLVAALRPLHPWAAPCTELAALHPFVATATAMSAPNASPGMNLKLFTFFIRSSPSQRGLGPTTDETLDSRPRLGLDGQFRQSIHPPSAPDSLADPYSERGYTNSRTRKREKPPRPRRAAEVFR